MRHYNKILLSSASVVSVLLTPLEANVFAEIGGGLNQASSVIQADGATLFAAQKGSGQHKLHAGHTAHQTRNENSPAHQRQKAEHDARHAHMVQLVAAEVKTHHEAGTVTLTEAQLAQIVSKTVAAVMNTPHGHAAAKKMHAVEKKRAVNAAAAPTAGDLDLEIKLKQVVSNTAKVAVTHVHGGGNIQDLTSSNSAIAQQVQSTFVAGAKQHELLVITKSDHANAVGGTPPKAATTPPSGAGSSTATKPAETPAASSGATTTGTSETTAAATTVAVVADPNASITSLTFAGQDLSKYPSLTSLTVPVGMLSTEIKHPNILNITVTGDALDTVVSLAKINATVGSLDLSGMKNVKDNKLDISQCLGAVSTVIVSGEISDLTLKSSVTSLTASTKLRVLRGASTALATRTGITDLTTLAVTGSDTTIPSWVTDGSLTQSGATIDVSGLTYLPAKLDVSSAHADVTGLVVGSNITNLIGSSRLTSLTAHSNLATLQNIDSLTSIVISGAGTQIPVWATNGAHTAAGASLDIMGMTALGTASMNLIAGQVLHGDVTEFKSHKTITGTLTLPATVVKLTVPDTATVAHNTNVFEEVTITGTTISLPAWLNNNRLANSSATLDLRGMTALTGTLDVSALNNLVGIKLTSGPTTLTAAAGVISITAPNSLATLTNSNNDIAFITLTGSGSTVPTWVTTAANTADPCVVDLTGMTSISSVDLSGNADLKVIMLPRTVTTATLNAAATTIVAGDTLTTLTGPTGLTSITLSGTNTTLPAWTKDEGLTAAGCLLDLTGELNLTGALNLSATGHDISTDIDEILVSDKITSITATAGIDKITASGKVTAITGTTAVDSITLVDEVSTTVPTWATDGVITDGSDTLDLTMMTKLPATLNLSAINSDITTVVVGSNITTLTLPTTVTTLTATPSLTTLTAGATLGTLDGATGLTTITLTGDGGGAFDANAWLNTTNKTATGATVNISGISNWGATTLNLATNTDITSLTIPNATTSLTVGTGMATLVGGNSTLATLVATTDLTTMPAAVDSLTSITLTGAGAVPTWITASGAKTGAGCTLNIAGVTGASAAIDLSNNDEIDNLALPTGGARTVSLTTSATSELATLSNAGAFLTTVNVGDALAGTTLGGASALTSITIKGSTATALNAAITDGTATAVGATLDISGRTNAAFIGANALNLAAMHADITSFSAPSGLTTGVLTVPATVKTLTIPGGLTQDITAAGNGLDRINVVGAGTLQAWLIDGSHMDTTSILDVSGLTDYTTGALDLKTSGLDADDDIIAPSTLTSGALTLPDSMTGNLTIPAELTTAPTAVTPAIPLLKVTSSSKTTLESFITDNSLTSTSATLDLSAMTGITTQSLDISSGTDFIAVVAPANMTTGTLTMAANVKTLTAPSTLTATPVVSGNALDRINLNGAASSVPSWATDGSLTDTTSILDLSAMTGLGTILNLTSMHTDITTVIVPSTVTTLTLPTHVTDLTAGTALTTLTAGMALASVTGPNALTSITLTGGSTSAIPGWVTTNANYTASPCTVDITGADSHATQTVGSNGDIVTLKLPAAVTTLNAGAANTTLLNLEATVALATVHADVQGLTSITLTGSTTVIPTWITSGASRTASPCMLDVSGATLSTAAQDISANTDIVTLKVPSSVTDITTGTAVTTLVCGSGVTTLAGPNALTSITVAGSDAAIPTVFTADDTKTASPCVLDVTGMTAITAVNLSSNSDIKTLKMSYPRLIHAGMTSVNLGSCTNLTLTGGSNVSDVDISKPTSATSVTTLDLTGMGLASAPTINHITDGFTAVTVISAAGSGLSDVTNIERNYSKTTITRTASPTSVTR